jgi:hypothetical protein
MAPKKLSPVGKDDYEAPSSSRPVSLAPRRIRFASWAPARGASSAAKVSSQAPRHIETQAPPAPMEESEA